METDEKTYPVPVGFFGTNAVTINANNRAYLVAKARLRLFAVQFGIPSESCIFVQYYLLRKNRKSSDYVVVCD